MSCFSLLHFLSSSHITAPHPFKHLDLNFEENNERGHVHVSLSEFLCTAIMSSSQVDFKISDISSTERIPRLNVNLYFKSDCLSFGIFVTWGLSIASLVVNNLINGEKCTGIYLLLFDLFGSNYDIRLKVICHVRSIFKPTQNSFRMLSVLSLMTICTALHFMLVRCMFDLHMYLIDLETLL